MASKILNRISRVGKVKSVANYPEIYLSMLKQQSVRGKLKGIISMAALGYSLGFRIKKPALPVFIQIEPTTRCNLRCIMCEHTNLTSKKKDMSLETFSKILDQIPSLLSIELTGLGEPFLHPKFYTLLKIAKDRNLHTVFTTNLTVFNKDWAKKLVGLGIDHIYVSLDGATKKTYENIRRGAKFEDVTQNLRTLVETKEEMNSKKPEITIRHVAMKNNLSEIPKLLKLVSDIGIKHIIITKLYSTEQSNLETDSNERDEIMESSHKLADQLGLNLEFRKGEKNPIKSCYVPFVSTYITTEGYVLPCCYVTQMKNYEILLEHQNFGNILNEPFKKIWRGKKYQALRKMIKMGRASALCKNCGMFG